MSTSLLLANYALGFAITISNYVMLLGRLKSATLSRSVSSRRS